MEKTLIEQALPDPRELNEYRRLQAKVATFRRNKSRKLPYKPRASRLKRKA